MFENIEVINNSDGSAVIVVDLNDEQIKTLESILGVSSSSNSEFQKSFEIFVNQALESYLNRG